LLRITLYTNCEGWRRMDNIFNLIPILWRLKHMCSVHYLVAFRGPWVCIQICQSSLRGAKVCYNDTLFRIFLWLWLQCVQEEFLRGFRVNWSFILLRVFFLLWTWLIWVWVPWVCHQTNLIMITRYLCLRLLYTV